NSSGLAPYTERLKARLSKPRAKGIVGANVGKNKETEDGAADYVLGIEAVSGLADYLVCNISSPHTPGLRAMQMKAPIEDLLKRVLAARDKAASGKKKPPLLAKVGPDLTQGQIEDIAEVALGTKVDGLIIGNTTIERPPTLKSKDKAE